MIKGLVIKRDVETFSLISLTAALSVGLPVPVSLINEEGDTGSQTPVNGCKGDYLFLSALLH